MNEYEKAFKEEDSMEKIYFIEEINQSELVGKSIRNFLEFWIKLTLTYFSFHNYWMFSISAAVL